MTQANDPIASIIVPCWNVAPWLPAALESAFAAAARLAPQHVEIICVDDGSTDGTAAILRAFAARDSRLAVLTQKNGGVSAARNAALARARGTYVFFLDPDDTLLPDALSEGIAAMEKTKADWAIAPFFMRTGENAPMRLVSPKKDYRLETPSDILRHAIASFVGYGFADVKRWFAGESLFAAREWGFVWRAVFRRSLIAAHGIRFDETLDYAEDAIFLCHYLLFASRTTMLEKPVYVYTQRAGGAVARHADPRRLVANKFRMRAARQRLDALCGNRLWPFYAASCVFAPLEILACARRAPLDMRRAWRAVRRYVDEPGTARALAACPLSWRRPLFSAAVRLLRLFTPRAAVRGA